MTVSGNSQISFAFIISIISISIAVYTVVRNTKKDNKNDIDIELKRIIETKENFVKVNMKLDELCRGNQAIQILLDKQGQDIKEMTKDISKNGNDIKTLFRYKDETFKRLEELEKGDI